jgi:hypothetical protein
MRGQTPRLPCEALPAADAKLFLAYGVLKLLRM